MPVMDGLKATRLIRSFEDTGNWGAAAEAGIEQAMPSSGLSNHFKRIPIIAVSTLLFKPTNTDLLPCTNKLVYAKYR